MALVDTQTAHEKVQEYQRSSKGRLWLIGAIAAAVVAAGVWAIVGDDRPVGSRIGTETPGSQSDMLEKLANQGYIPKAALNPMRTPVSERQATADAVSKGLVPEEALERNDPAVEDLVNRGLVPRQALDEVP